MNAAVKTKSKTYRPFEPPNRYGWGFNADKGTLTFFTPRSLRTYKADPPACWERHIDYPKWRGSFGGEDFQIGYLADVNQRYKVEVGIDLKAGHRVKRPGLYALKRFYHRLDPKVVELTRGLTSQSWLHYCALVRVPELADIAASNPALAVALSLHRKGQGWRFRRLRRLVRKKRTRLLGELGLPAQKSWLKVMGRIPVEAISSEAITQLRNAARFSPNAIKQLRHFPVVHGGVFTLLDRSIEPFVAWSLLREVAGTERLASPWQFGAVRNRVVDSVRMAALAQRDVPVFRSLAQLSTFHDERARGFRRTKLGYTRPFGPPPVADSESIVALRTPADLRAEAEAQDNCLAAGYWAEDCYRGKLYFYRMEKPERASIAIAPGKAGDWWVYEFKAHANTEPSPAAMRALNAWLHPSTNAQRAVYVP